MMGFPGVPGGPGSGGGGGNNNGSNAQAVAEAAAAKREVAALTRRVTELQNQNAQLTQNMQQLQTQAATPGSGGGRGGGGEGAAELQRQLQDVTNQAWQLDAAKRDLEGRLQASAQKLSRSKHQSKEVVARFRSLKEQNVRLKQTIDKFRAQMAAAKQEVRGNGMQAPLVTPGGPTQFPDTPSAF